MFSQYISRSRAVINAFYIELNQINKNEEFSTNAIRGKYLEDPQN